MKHYCKKYIILNIFRTIPAIIFVLLLIIGNFEGEINDSIAMIIGSVFLGLLALAVIFSILSYKFTYYYFTDNEVILKRGIIFKSQIKIDYSHIHAIDYSQSILQRVLRIKTLKIDSGSTVSASTPEVIIVDNIMEMDRIEAEIRSRMGEKKEAVDIPVEDDKRSSEYRFDVAKKFLYSLLNLLVVLVILVGFSICSLIIYIVLINEDVDAFWLTLAIVLFAFAVISYFSGVIHQLINGYNYSISVNDKYIVIDHGLLAKYHNTLPIKKIKAVVVEEGLVKRIFGYASVKIEVVGFGSDAEKQSGGYLFPLIKKNQVNQYLEGILPSMCYTEPNLVPEDKTFRFFMFVPSMVILVLGLISSIYVAIFALQYVFIPIAVTFLLLVIILIYALLEKYNAGVRFMDDKLVITNGSFIKKTTLIPRKSLIGVELRNTYCRRKAHVGIFVIHYFNNAFKNTEKVNFLDEALIDNFQNYVNK